MARLLLVSTVIVAVVEVTTASSCIPFEQCQSLRDLWAGRLNISIPGKTQRETQRDISAFIRRQRCGTGRKVRCPDNAHDDEEVDGDGMQAMHGVGDVLRESLPSCQGVLKLHTISASTLESQRPMAIRTNVETLNKMEERVLVKAVVSGQCCWKLSSLRQYGGQSQVLGLGHVGRPNVKPLSVGIVNCQP